MTIGSVGVPGPSVKKAMTNSSSDSVKTSRAPATMAGASAGTVMRKNVDVAASAQVAAGLLEARVDLADAGGDDGGHEGHAEHDVREEHGVQTERHADGAEHHEQSDREREVGDDRGGESVGLEQGRARVAGQADREQRAEDGGEHRGADGHDASC